MPLALERFSFVGAARLVAVIAACLTVGIFAGLYAAVSAADWFLFVAAALLQVGVVLLLVWLAYRFFAGRLRPLVWAVARLGRGELSVRVTDVRRGDELGLLADAFNNMVERLERLRTLEHDVRERFELAMESASDGLCDWNVREGTAYYSHKLYTMLGYEPDESWPDIDAFRALLHPGEAGAVWGKIEAYLRHDSAQLEQEFRLRHRKGHYIWVLCRALGKFDDSGQAVRLVGTLVDISARKDYDGVMERMRQQLEERVEQRTLLLQAANSELESFVYSVSHDLRAPVRRIKGFSKALEDDCAASMAPACRTYLDRVVASSLHLDSLIESLLQLSRVARQSLSTTELDMAELARDIMSGLQNLEPGRQVAFRCPSSIPVRADARLLRVVLENLLGNAWKYTAKTEVATIELGFYAEGMNMVYYVTDNGAGFDMAGVSRLFVPFQRLHSDTEFEGNGVGLASVQRIINRHGGRVWGEGESGKGARFFFTLPPHDTGAIDHALK